MGLNEASERNAAVIVTSHSLYLHFTELLSSWLIVVSPMASALGGSRELELNLTMGLNEAGERIAAVMITMHSLYVHFTEPNSDCLIVVRIF
jgi:hypothetical protein